ncbi:MAG: hypothetical protein KDD18_06900, partial [Mangrovimonas sp.]|nr:hypothetical protein [Mangrovimonas sp.]
KMDYCPFVKDHVLYFTSKRDLTIDKPKAVLDYDALLEELWKYDNGSSRVYRINFETLKN